MSSLVPAPPLPDAEDRRIATSEFEQNLVVIAGAGTGKTSLLVERLVTAIGARIVRIEEIAAITFTEKAAGELRNRLALALERLRLLARDSMKLDLSHEADRAFAHLTGHRGVTSSEIEARALEALTGLDRARVGTIHGFCAELLRDHPLEARVDPGFAVDPGEHFKSLFEEEWELYLSEELGPRARHPELWRGLLRGAAPAVLRDAASEIASLRVSEAALAPLDRGFDPLSVIREEVKPVLEKAEEILKLEGITATNEEYFGFIRDSLRVLLARGLSSFQEWFRNRPDCAVRLERKTDPGTKLRGISAQEFKEAVRASKQLVDALLGVDEAYIGSLLEALAPLARRLREKLLARGLVGFDALLTLVRDLLRDHPGVREELKRRFRLILVDELQDTDPVQYEIVLFLGEREGSATGKDAYEVDLEPGRLFLVGDPKQSIYRFRGADYDAFSEIVDRVKSCGGRELNLTANFRSRDKVLKSVNRLFDPAQAGSWVESDHLQPRYVSIEVPDPASAAGGEVEVWTVALPEGALAGDRREAEGKVIAGEIRRWVEEEGRCKYKDVTLLLRAFTNLSLYLRPLRAAGIPFIVDGGREFLKRPEVTQLLAALRALALPSDQVALLAFLRSPAGGVPDTELAEHAASGGRWSFEAEPDSGRVPTLAAAFQTLRALAAEIRDLPPDAAVERTVARTDLLPLSAAAFEGSQRIANLRKLVALAAELARDGTLSLLDVIDALEEGTLGEVDADSPIADENSDAVRVMTIHKAKGLENRVVVVADLARSDRSNSERPIVRISPRKWGHALGLEVEKRRNALRVLLDRLEERHDEAEDARVLYVALTRAKERLVLLCANPGKGAVSSWMSTLGAWGYDPEAPPAEGAQICDGLVLHRVLAPEDSDRAAVRKPHEDMTHAVEAYDRARAALSASPHPQPARPSALHEKASGPAAPSGDGPSAARAVGSAAHRWLESWTGGGLDDAGLRRRAREAAREEGVDPESVEREALSLARRFLDSPLAERLRTADVLGREVPILLRRGATSWTGSLDLLYRDPSGALVVADFKTDHDDDAALLGERYREQIAVYREAVQVALKLPAPPRGELWLLRHGKIVTL